MFKISYKYMYMASNMPFMNECVIQLNESVAEPIFKKVKTFKTHYNRHSDVFGMKTALVIKPYWPILTVSVSKIKQNCYFDYMNTI